MQNQGDLDSVNTENAHRGAADPGERTYSVVYRTGGQTIATRHTSQEAAVRTAADIRVAFPWLDVAVIPEFEGTR